MFVDNPGMSIVAIDPGGTTGIAIWDAWTQKLYVDQIDAGRGRRAVERVQSGRIESMARHKTKRAVGKTNEMAIINLIERGVVDVLCDVILAVGPLSAVVFEDFVLSWGRDDRPVRSSGREGLSPVRLGARMDAVLHYNGMLNGDAWRRWGVFQAYGSDGRGVRVKDVSGVLMPYPQRVHRAEVWRLGGCLDEGNEVVWAGGGIKFIWRLPGMRHWLSGGEKASVAWLRENGMWMPGAPHGMDALMHLLAFARKLNCDIRQKPERLWAKGVQTKISV